MFGCTGGDFTYGLLDPEFGAGRTVRSPVEGLYLWGAGCHGGPGVTFVPDYHCGDAVLDATGAAGRPPVR
jgi:phytoene dehydrogenase-like protein